MREHVQYGAVSVPRKTPVKTAMILTLPPIAAYDSAVMTRLRGHSECSYPGKSFNA